VLALSNARLVQTLDHQDLRRDASTIQLNVGYRGSALARDDRDDTAVLRAGDRAPDATRLTTADGEHRLFELIRGGQFTLLSFAGGAPVENPPPGIRILRVVERPTDPGEVADTGGHLARAYAATGRTLVLIRPDGYVALISDAGEMSAVSDYLAAIGRVAAVPAA
jgi:hypothetical protein